MPVARCRSGVTFCDFIKRRLQHLFCQWLLLKIISECKRTLNNFRLMSVNFFSLILLNLIELLMNCLIKLKLYRSSYLRMLFRPVLLKNLEMFQKNTGGGLQIFRKVYLINVKRIKKHIINSIYINWQTFGI